MTTIKASSEEEIEGYKRLFSSSTALRHPNLAAPLEFFFNKQEAFCGSFHKIQVVFEHFELDLDQDIRQRAATECFYSEEELWYIAESVIQSMAYLTHHKIPYGYLTPQNILISTDENPVYKIFVQCWKQAN
jgi:serine/threonine protein kinase